MKDYDYKSLEKTYKIRFCSNCSRKYCREKFEKKIIENKIAGNVYCIKCANYKREN